MATSPTSPRGGNRRRLRSRNPCAAVVPPAATGDSLQKDASKAGLCHGVTPACVVAAAHRFGGRRADGVAGLLQVRERSATPGIESQVRRPRRGDTSCRTGSGAASSRAWENSLSLDGHSRDGRMAVGDSIASGRCAGARVRCRSSEVRCAELKMRAKEASGRGRGEVDTPLRAQYNCAPHLHGSQDIGVGGGVGGVDVRTLSDGSDKKRWCPQDRSVPVGADATPPQGWMCTMVPSPVRCEAYAPCHPSGSPGVVQKKNQRASIGDTFTHPWLRGFPKSSCQYAACRA